MSHGQEISLKLRIAWPFDVLNDGSDRLPEIERSRNANGFRLQRLDELSRVVKHVVGTDSVPLTRR